MESNDQQQNTANINIHQNQESYQNNDEYDIVNGGTGGNELSFDAKELSDILPPPTKFMNVKDSIMLGQLQPG